MKRKYMMASAAAMLVVATGAEARDLTIAGWGGAYNEAQRESHYAPFAAIKGSSVAEDTYLGGLAEIKAMVEAGNPKWDLLIVEGAELQLGCDEGLFEPLDWDAIGGKNVLVPEAVSDCGAGSYVWGTGLAFNTDAVGANAPVGWADFWDTATWPGKRGLRAGPKTNLEFALLADGVAPDQVYDVLSTSEGLDRAFAKLDEIRDDIQFWDAGAQPMEWLAAGNVVMSSAYNARASRAAAEGRPVGFSWVNSHYSIDSWVIPAGSPHKDLAMEFIAFANSAEPQTRFAELFSYGPTNVAGVANLSPELAQRLPAGANIDTAFLSDEVFWTDNIDQISERWNVWVTR